ncbi:F510_1955 family glycosylhydrolase [Paenibacillus mesotrionivorans]|uniref:F510_1955 family glycosylhydrolase n=1 Tax=Paenibacillus mesotrionivorans TaxID=3160968 RepID=A0ACC7NZR7_9BACL
MFCLICAGLTAKYWSLPNRKEARGLKTAALLAGSLAVLMGAFNSSGMWESRDKKESMNLIQIYGMTYDRSGSGIMVATHEGIKWWRDNRWQSEGGDRHDFVAFAPFEGGFYASGKPGPGSKLPNPLGLAKSTDAGQNVQLLALEGKVEFHYLASTVRSPATIYGYHETYGVQPLRQPGLYHTTDEGGSWMRSSMKGFEGEPTGLAVHPERPELVAMGARDGLFLSQDKGNTFEKVLPGLGISSLSFDRDGMITAGTFKDKPALLQLDSTGKQTAEIPLPELKGDAVAFSAHNPVKPEERVISTYEHDLYLTSDGGATWYQLAAGGKTKPAPERVPVAGQKPEGK